MIALTSPQSRARNVLAAEFGPAIVWSHRVDQAIQCETDTQPTLVVQIESDGGVSSPLSARRRLRECDGFEPGRVTRVIRRMTAVAC